MGKLLPRVYIEVRVMQGRNCLLKYRKAAVTLLLARMWLKAAKRVVEGYW